MPKVNLKPRFWIMKLAKSCLFLNQWGRRGGEGKGGSTLVSHCPWRRGSRCRASFLFRGEEDFRDGGANKGFVGAAEKP